MNLLSYPQGSIFSGKQIKDFSYEYINSTDKVKQRIAKAILGHYSNIKEDRFYKAMFWCGHPYTCSGDYSWRDNWKSCGKLGIYLYGIDK